jgi:hypothetical protein
MNPRRFIGFLLSLSCLSSSALATVYVSRSVPEVAWAIGKSRPSMPAEQRKEWARAIIREAKTHAFDPFTLIAIADHESGLHPGVIGGMDGQCVGLGQTCLHRYLVCRESFVSPECAAHRNRLLYWRAAVTQIATDIGAWRATCKRLTGRTALLSRWLAGYQGIDYKYGTTCGQRKVRGRWQDAPRSKLTRNVMRYRLHLIAASKKAR